MGAKEKQTFLWVLVVPSFGIFSMLQRGPCLTRDSRLRRIRGIGSQADWRRGAMSRRLLLIIKGTNKIFNQTSLGSDSSQTPQHSILSSHFFLTLVLSGMSRSPL